MFVDITDYSIDVEAQKVVVSSTKSSDEVKEAIEKTGKLAVLVGSGGGGSSGMIL